MQRLTSPFARPAPARRATLAPTPRHHAARRIAVALMTTLAACGTNVDDHAPTGLAPAMSLGLSGDVHTRTQQLARGIASALSEPRLRADLRNAMRDSRWTEHKLLLQAYAETPRGRALLAAAAAHLGLTTEALAAAVTALPPLDFYLPFRQHRITWRGSPEILVAATYDGEAPSIEAFAATGQVVKLYLADGLPARPLVLLQPAELKGVLSPSEPYSNGDVIQLAGEAGVTHGAFVGWEAEVTRKPDPLGDAASHLLYPGDTYTPPPPAPGIYITHYNIQTGDGWFGDSEMQFRSYAISGFNGEWGVDWPIHQVSCDLGTAYQNGVEEDKGWYGLLMLSPNVRHVGSVTCPSAPLRSYAYSVNIVEMDGGLNFSNDNFGWRFYTYGPTPIWNAAVGTVERYYWNGTLHAYLRLEYR